MKEYKINVSGCDDHTEITMLLSAEQFTFLNNLAHRITESGGGCKPTMYIELLQEVEKP